ncbi:DUF2642 domain-containing protein [Fictibacillus iocasae]|uniref:DUF2642 domain-containing protein n=1 Tax=Fictibacillus iocasae TaxID=2715437 RepID=A0ABW2NMC2_9BACL
MSIINQNTGENIEVTLSGNLVLKGILIEVGTDIMVIYNGKDFYYIPLVHTQYIRFHQDTENEVIKQPDEWPIGQQDNAISVRKTLTNSKGIFSEIYVNNHQPIHGYVTGVMNDYFLFFSPVHKLVCIPLQHFKWLMPYHDNERPYSLKNEEFPLVPISVSSARTFEEQMRRNLGKIAVFDLGKEPRKIGKLVSIHNQQVELSIARSETLFTNLQHVHCVSFL